MAFQLPWLAKVETLFLSADACWMVELHDDFETHTYCFHYHLLLPRHRMDGMQSNMICCFFVSSAI